MHRILLAFICSVIALGSAVAGESPWVETEFSRLRLISEQDQVGGGAPLHFGLQLEMGSGWKSYWRTPGDAGLPPSFDWQAASSNIASVEFLFPAPHRFTLFGLDTFGYEGEVIFPLRVTPINPEKPMTLAGNAFYMVCEEICVPFQADLSMTLQPGAAQPARQAYLIGKYLEQVPGDGSEDGLTLSNVRLEGDPATPRLIAKVTGTTAFTALDLVVEGPEGYSFRQPEIALSGEGKEAELTLRIIKGPQVSVPLEGATLTLTLLDGVKGLETNLVPLVAFGAGDGALFWQALILALLGGLILNVMPCVLPVLSMKLLSLVGQGGREKREIRLSFLFTTLGILVSFLALAGVVLALKAGGGAFGWGVQFQEPVFLAAMAAVTTFFSASLFGFFSVRLPGALADLGARHQAHGHGGQFLTGLFAVLLATPCTAPFVTPAVGFALTHGTLEILAIFLALGLGLSSPYLLVAAFPALAQRLPRPGRWILKVKFVLGLALVGTAIWLLSVLLEQVGWTVTLVTAGLLTLLLALLGFWRQRQGIAVAALVALLAAALPALLPASQRDSALPDGWLAFDRAKIDEEVAAGSVVFVDVTAAWCVTCLANKTLVLDRAEVVEALGQEGVIAMQADWTRPDEAIRQFLTDNGRFGIPFNIIYGPGAPQGLVLPEILSVGAVLDGLAAAR